MDYKHMTSPCGVDCFNCPMYLAKTNDKIRQAVVQRLNLSYEDAICEGCRGEKGAPAAEGLSETCRVYRCTEDRGISFCCECSDFPCDHFQPYADQASIRPHNTKLFNLGLIKKMGLEDWARNKAKSVRDTYFTEKFHLH